MPPGRYGALDIDDGKVTNFLEKPTGDRSGRINGGFFVLEKEVLNFIDGDHSSFENEPISKMVQNNALFAFEHEGFWRPMDTQRDAVALNKLWETGKAPWKTW